MIIEKNLDMNYDLIVPAELLKMASLNRRVRIIVDEYEIKIKQALSNDDVYQKMIGLGQNIFDADSVTLQKSLRTEWKI